MSGDFSPEWFQLRFPRPVPSQVPAVELRVLVSLVVTVSLLDIALRMARVFACSLCS